MMDMLRMDNSGVAQLAVSNTPFFTLATLLAGVHSISIRTHKGSIYRVRFVAPDPHSSCASTPATKVPASCASTPATKVPASVAGRESTPTTSTAYPLLFCSSAFSSKWFVLYGTVPAYDKMEKEFRDLVDVEMEAVDALNTSDSSSATDTNWMHAGKGSLYALHSTAVSYRPMNFCSNHGSNYYVPTSTTRQWVHDPNSSGTHRDDKSRDMYLQQNVTGHILHSN